jgi:integrase
LSPDEMGRLGAALAKCPDKQGAAIIGLLLLTGARSGEVRSMRWADLDLRAGIWTKLSSHTKQKKNHRVPISAPALALFKALRAEADKGAIYIFPSHGSSGYRAELKKTWAWITKAAKVRECRIHDLRHSYASVLASSGHSLPTIGRLLGHSNPVTTARYAHLFDDPLREATERAGQIISAR